MMPIPSSESHVVAIVDYGMGNLFSVHAACARAGIPAMITADPDVVVRAPAVILPGVGAFGDAMATLHARGLVEALRSAARIGTPVVGICLGMQLLATESEEFGIHEGLGIIPGRVVHLGTPRDAVHNPLRTPHIGWNSIARRASDHGDPWTGTPLDGVPDETEFYFVHSFRVIPERSETLLAVTRYGDVTFAAAVRSGNTYGFQFHPERSGEVGARVYARLAALITHTYATDR